MKIEVLTAEATTEETALIIAAILALQLSSSPSKLAPTSSHSGWGQAARRENQARFHNQQQYRQQRERLWQN